MSKLLFCILSFSLAICNLHAQAYLEIIDDDSTETNEERMQFIIEFMSSIEFNTCADIGSGNLELSLKIANAFPDKEFVFEDIDSSLCNRANMLEQIARFDLRDIEPHNIKLIIGDTLFTSLNDQQFDLVLISGLIHEINDKDAFFTEMKRILKPNGNMLISDAFYENPPRPHKGCSNRFLTHHEMEHLIQKQSLTILKDWKREGITTLSNGPYTSRVLLCMFK